jgi:DNA-binding transcriptional ArsR family regulator
MAKQESIRDIVSVAKALSDESRVRALLALEGGELCLCQLIELLGLAPSTVSKHLAVLQDARLVERRKAGRWAFYRLAGDDAPDAARAAVEWVLGSSRRLSAMEVDAAEMERIRNADLETLSTCYRS